MTACCWPQERGLMSHTLACILRPPHVRAVPDHPATPPDHDTAPSAEEETEDA